MNIYSNAKTKNKKGGTIKSIRTVYRLDRQNYTIATKFKT